MEEKKIAAEPPIKVAGVTLIPVTRISLRYWSAKGSAYFFGLKQPVDVVVVSQSAKQAFRITGEEVSLEKLVKEAPGLKEMLK